MTPAPGGRSGGAAEPEPTRSSGDLLRRLSGTATRLAAEVGGPLRRVSVQAEGAAVELEWEPGALALASRRPPAGIDGGANGGVEANGDGDPRPDPARGDDDAALVRSPMVGTFYHAPAPGEPPFVSIGGEVGPDTVVGIIEAMKLMNQVTADRIGVVRQVLVPDGRSVEFDQPLFALDMLPDPEGRDR
ncbi:MAG TPA: biotin/lipoyl-containing protein [Mycobacteriales bacterium]|nr:biotin/lipoyl-containing protein [Mycobacteriales bacterium]